MAISYRVLLVSVLALMGCSMQAAAWRVPLDILPTPQQSTIFYASDSLNIYVTNARGVLFAVRAIDGAVQWSTAIGGTGSQVNPKVFPEFPGYVFTETNGYGCQIISTSSGTVDASIPNCTYIRPAGSAGLLVAKAYSVSLMTTAGTTLWSYSIDESFGNLGHIAASSSVCAVVVHPASNFFVAQLLTFSTDSGVMLCNITKEVNLQPFVSIPFEVVAGNFLISGHGTSDVFTPYVFDLITCRVFNTKYVPTTFSFQGTYITLLNAKGSLYYTNVTEVTPQGDWNVTVTKNIVGSDVAVWQKKLQTPAGGALAPVTPVVGNTAFQPDAIIISYGGGYIGAFNDTTGEEMWTITQRVPFGPSNNNQQFVYPMGSGKLFIPNLQGYIVIDVRTGTIVERNEMTPILAAVSFLTTAGTPGVVYIDGATGDVVGKNF